MINEYSNGRMTVEGKTHRKDLKIIGDRVISNWWRSDGHNCDAEDVKDILSASPDTLVVGRGYASNMHIQKSLQRALKEKGIKLIADDTYQAVEIFNTLRSKGENVAGAFHLTC